MRPTPLAALALLSLLAPLTARAQYDDRAQKWLQNCENNWNNGRANFCELRNITLRPESKISVAGRQNGGVAFYGWDRNEVRVIAMIQVNADDDNQAEALAKQIRINTNGGRISAEGPSSHRRSWWSVSYEIYVPTRSNLEAVTQNGGVSAEDVEGDLDFQAMNGGIRVANIAGDVRGETTNGGISASLSGSSWRGKGLDLRTMNGGVSLTIPRGYNARLETGTTNGGMRVDFPITVRAWSASASRPSSEPEGHWCASSRPTEASESPRGNLAPNIVRRARISPYISGERKRLPVMPTDEKPSKNEDEYFAKQNAEIIRDMRAKLDAERKKAERWAHHNKCPRCGADLKERHAENVKIDECQECGGVWLDRGELEQLARVNRARGVSGGVLGSLFKRG